MVQIIGETRINIYNANILFNNFSNIQVKSLHSKQSNQLYKPCKLLNEGIFDVSG